MPTDPFPLERACPGAFDAAARLVDMDSEGIDVAVLYPTIGGARFRGITDPEAAVPIARAYNDWWRPTARSPRTATGGLGPCRSSPPPKRCAKWRRACEELGFVAVFVGPNPCLGRSIVDDVYEPFWDVAEELDMAVGIHEGFQPAVPPLGGTARPRNFLVMHAVSHTFEQMFACAQLIAEGVLDRHPGLRVVFLEAGGGWVPYWLGRLDSRSTGTRATRPDAPHAQRVLRAAVLGVVRDRRGDAARR